MSATVRTAVDATAQHSGVQAVTSLRASVSSTVNSNMAGLHACFCGATPIIALDALHTQQNQEAASAVLAELSHVVAKGNAGV